MNILDSVIAAFSPERAVRRAHMRQVLASYEGGKSTRKRKKPTDNSTGDRLVARDAATVRATMRNLERNYDLVRGALQTLTRNVIGPTGIMVEPTPRRGGTATYDDIDDDFARTLLNLWREWTESPEVTRTLDWVQLQELACRTWLRDGEVFAQLVEGNAAFIRHRSSVPLSIELLEADHVPLDFEDQAKRIVAGIERNAWGEPTYYHVLKEHPGNGGWYDRGSMKAVPANRMLHLAIRERFTGLRGISQFASTIDRLFDIKDYENSEQLAARAAARVVMSVKRDAKLLEAGWSFPVDDEGNRVKDADRDMFLDVAAVFDKLWPGESLEMADPTRPNPNLGGFRLDQIRAASRAASLSCSSFSGDYDGTYSAQRQELVESYDGHRMLTHQFVASFVRPIWKRFVALAIASGRITVPAGIRPETVDQANFRGPKMPWIDPQREAAGLLALSRGGWQSVTQGIAERGGRLQDVFEEIARERELADELGLILDSDARYTSRTGVTQARQGDTAFPDPDPDPDAASGGRTRTRASRSQRTGTDGVPQR